jgi:hypothetical protein
MSINLVCFVALTNAFWCLDMFKSKECFKPILKSFVSLQFISSFVFGVMSLAYFIFKSRHVCPLRCSKTSLDLTFRSCSWACRRLKMSLTSEHNYIGIRVDQSVDEIFMTVKLIKFPRTFKKVSSEVVSIYYKILNKTRQHATCRAAKFTDFWYYLAVHWFGSMR